jgi:NADH:ubiquinone oxidoreductase subunit 4 (subunit M)
MLIILEVLSVVLTTVGVFCTTSQSTLTRRKGFILLMFAGLCSIFVFQDKALFYMLAQSVLFMGINARGIYNNPKETI